MQTHADTTSNADGPAPLGNCDACQGASESGQYGERDGLVRCRECDATLFYCDLGGQG